MTAEPASAEIRTRADGPIQWIEIANPARRNAMTMAMWEALPRRLADIEHAAGTRVIVLRGAGTEAFSAGADISEFERVRNGPEAQRYEEVNHRAFEALLQCQKPTIAMIHGFCFGGGLALALCCDIRIADAAAQFAIPAARLGIGYNPRWLPPLLAAVPPAYAKEMLFTGRRTAAPEAASVGLVNRVVAHEVLEETARDMATTIAANAPLSIAAAKRGIDEWSRRPESPDLATLDAIVKACFASTDYVEGRRAFLEKRTPEFKGR